MAVICLVAAVAVALSLVWLALVARAVIKISEFELEARQDGQTIWVG